MKKLLSISILSLMSIACCAQGNKQFSIEIENPAQIKRTDEAIVLTRAQLSPANDLLPAVIDANGNYIPSQVDDIDADGKWDELAFVKNLNPLEKATLKIVWVEKAKYPEFPIRTNIRYGLMVSDGVVKEQIKDMHYKESKFFINTKGYPYQMDGIAWENDKVGFRHYYDGRNCRDYFGKLVSDMVLDTVGIKPNGFPGDTYHVWADWGRDIYSVGTSFGLGGIGAWVNNDHFVRLGRLASEHSDRIDSTGFSIITEGPVRSMFAMDFHGWDIEGTKIDKLRQITTIWAGTNNYDNKVIAKNIPSNIKLITGITCIFNGKPLEQIDMTSNTIMATHDHQSYNKEFIMSTALIVPNKNLTKIFNTPDKGAELIKTWCAELNLVDGEADYKAYGVWEHHQDKMFRDRDYFLEYMKNEGIKADNPVKVTLK